MITTHSGWRGLANQVWLQRLALAICGVLSADETVLAQTVPFEAAQRGRIGTGLGQSSLPQGGTFEPRIDMAVQYGANFNLAADGQPQIDMAGIKLSPGFYASLSNQSVTAAIDYALIGLAWEESDFNDVTHRLQANGQWITVPEWFAINSSASYEDGIIDPRSSLFNYGTIGAFGAGNVQEVATATVNPILQHRFNMVEVAADYRYGRVWYFDQGKGQETASTAFSDDSIDQSGRVTVGTAQDSTRMFATAFYDWRRSEYDNAIVPFEFERAGLNAGLQVARTLSIVGDGGKETDLTNRAALGGLDAGFWSAGLRWTPSDRTTAEARYGDRSFGDYYFLSATHRARLLEFNVAYTEQPTVETQRLSLGDIVPGELPSGIPGVDVGIFNNLPQILREARMSVEAKGSRTTLDATVFWYERDYLASQGYHEEGYGAGLRVTRQLASNLSADIDVEYRDFEQLIVDAPELDFVSRGTRATLRLNRTLSERLTLGAEAGYFLQTGDRDFDGWWVSLRARYMP